MPQWDRFWPFGLLAALAFLAASGSLAVWYLASLVVARSGAELLVKDL